MKDYALKVVRLCRWVACFPAAMFISFLSWPLATKMFPHVTYGPSLISKVGATPLVLRTALPAFVFTVIGVLVAPGRGRKVCFVFFGLALVFSAGGLELLSYSDADGANLTLWVAASTGILLGSAVGLWCALEFQSPRSRPPNKAPEPTPTSVTSPAAQEPRQP